ncbi:MAG: ABC transporter permease [Planctomycetales bacterium]|nr:ABC transporter permease [bacterium]UNM07134.1 MAG: ABC transporter permease [Planctomycetales bacterium]
MLKYFLRQGMVQIRRYLVQSSLAILGVAIGVANVIMLISITDLGRRQTMGMINEFGANVFMVSPYIDFKAGPFANMKGASVQLPDESWRVVEPLPEVENVAPALMLPGYILNGEKQSYTTLFGINQYFLESRGHEIDKGRFLQDGDIEEQSKVLVLGPSVAAALFGEDEDIIGREVQIRDEPFKVVGLLKTRGRVGMEDMDNAAYMPLEVEQELLGFVGVTGFFVRYSQQVGEEKAMAAVRDALQTTLNDGEILEESYSVFTVKDAVKLMDKALEIFKVVLLGVSSIALLVAGIGIMNVMLIRVIQRRPEIGIRRAVGASQGQVAIQFLIEACVKALIGAVIGIGLGVLGVFIYCNYTEWEPWVSPRTIALGALFSIAVGLIFGSWPAARAAKQDPVACLRSEI